MAGLPSMVKGLLGLEGSRPIRGAGLKIQWQRPSGVRNC